MPYKQYDCSVKYLPYRAPFWGKKIRYLFGCEWNDLGKNVALHRFSHNTLYFSFKICAWNEILSSLHPIPPPPHFHHNAHPQKQTRMTVVKNMLFPIWVTMLPKWYLRKQQTVYCFQKKKPVVWIGVVFRTGECEKLFKIKNGENTGSWSSTYSRI